MKLRRLWPFNRSPKVCRHCRQRFTADHDCVAVDRTVSYSDDSDFLLSAAVAYATDSEPIGAMVGGDMLGAVVGASLRSDSTPDDPQPAPDSPVPVYDPPSTTNDPPPQPIELEAPDPSPSYSPSPEPDSGSSSSDSSSYDSGSSSFDSGSSDSGSSSSSDCGSCDSGSSGGGDS